MAFRTKLSFLCALLLGYAEQGHSAPVVCPADAITCPDGTFVGRLPPTCEFEPCYPDHCGDEICRSFACDDEYFPEVMPGNCCPSTCTRDCSGIDCTECEAGYAPGTPEGECCPNCVKANEGGVMDDPHFKTWSGKWYDFMGACDLHLVNAPFFAPDTSLVIDIRTKIRYAYSYIESAVVAIGEDTLEVGSWGEYSLNGVAGALETEGSIPTIGGYPINYTNDFKKVHKFEIQISEGETILVKTFKDMVSILVNNANVTRFHGSQGMMGEFQTGTMLARDGKTVIEEPNAFAAEWQVRETEPMLFRTVSGPQHPQACDLPDPSTKTTRRLGESIAREAAEKACAQWSEDTREACIFDVMATGDLDLAAAGAF